jgi:hypothetical protein
MVLSTFELHQIPKRGGVGEWLPSKGHSKNTYKNNKISILKYFSCFTLDTKSREIVIVIRGGSEW